MKKLRLLEGKPKHFFILAFSLFLISCGEAETNSSVNPENWLKREVNLSDKDSLDVGSTYLSVYSSIYSLTEHKTHNLTATISLRNVNEVDSIYITSANYFDTHGKKLRNYIVNDIFIAPMETVEIVIDEHDAEGGTGANFLFTWAKKKASHKPYFEAVMISTSGQQGLSFSTQGVNLD